ncbi:unnamed protein product [Paramecium sonneborni]|uniref:WD40-repeat-containing domain n=1 Tax=Paramecium sonneborni TaxID=65129 RepID=A0A8S1RC19_9CILI|nr:unnamed protein product [Paramecium sonneborni]
MQKILDNCQLHKKEGIAVEYLVRDENNYLILCENCLAEKANKQDIFLLKDAEQVFEQFRSQYSSQFEQEQSETIILLKNMQEIVQKLQNHFQQRFDQINLQIIERIESIALILESRVLPYGNQENQNVNLNIKNFAKLLIDEISRCDILKKTIQEQSLIEFHNIIQHEIMRLQQNDIFNECLDSLIQIEEKRKIKFIDYKEICIEQEKGSIKRTPKLDLICKEHDKEIILFDLNEQQKREKRAKCVECDPCLFTSLTKCQNMWSNYEKQQSEIMYQFYKSRKSQIGIIKQQLFNLKSSFIEKIHGIILQLNDIMAQTEQDIFKSLYSMNKDWNTMSLNEVLDIIEILSKPDDMQLHLIEMEIKYQMENLNIDSMFQNSIEEINNQIIQLNLSFIYKLSDNKNIYRSPKNSDIIKQRSNSIKSDKSYFQIKEQKSDQKIKKLNNQIKSLEEWRILQLKWSNEYIDYKQFYSKKQAEWCNAIAFNKEGNIMIAGSIFTIKIFDFLKGRIVQTYQAQQHTGDINCLLFSKKINQFISGSDDNTIIIWTQIDQNKWKSQILEGHQGWVLCLTQTENEQIIISGSRDHTIRIWVKVQDEYKCEQVLDDHFDSVYGLSLNKSEQYMVSCSQDKSIIVWEIKDKFKMEKKQIIEQDTYGYRILFINDNQFLWQPYNKNVHIYQYNSEIRCFQDCNHNIQQVLADDDYQYFPSQFIQSKGVFANIHNKHLYIIKQINEEEFDVIQRIDFNDYRKFGAFTEDGEYLVTWNYTKSEFQIRKNVGSSRVQW